MVTLYFVRNSSSTKITVEITQEKINPYSKGDGHLKLINKGDQHSSIAWISIGFANQ